MIAVTQAVRDAIIAGEIPVKLIEIQFTTGTLQLTTGGYDFDWGGATWIANGFVLKPPADNRVNELRSSKDTLTVTGVDPTIVQTLLAVSQIGREVIVRDAFLDGNGGVIADPYIVDQYIINSFKGEIQPGSGTISISLAGEFADFQFVNGIRTTDASLQRYHPGDRLFEYSTDVAKDQERRWGGR